MPQHSLRGFERNGDLSPITVRKLGDVVHSIESNCPIAHREVLTNEMNETEKKRLAIGQTLLGIWWVSWFGIIGGFLLAGGQEDRRELSQSVGSSPFSLALLIVIVSSWVVFYIATSKFEEQWPVVWRLF